MAKKSTYFTDDLKQFKTLLTNYTSGLADGARDITENAAKDGAAIMRLVVATSGTGWENRQGRIETGEMYNDIDAAPREERISARGNSVIQWEFGWINGFEDYYRYQEEGFNNIWKSRPSADGGGPRHTLPMNAYATAYTEISERFKNDMRAYVNKKGWD